MIKDQISSKKSRKKVTKVEIGGPGPPEEPHDRPTPCTVLAVVITLFILIILIISIGQLGFHDKSAFEWDKEAMKKPPRTRLNLPCQTEECVHYSSELFEMMSTSIDPCDDFHTHVCDGYDPKKRKFERLLKLIDTSDKPDHDKAMKVVRRMLSRCAVERKEFEKGLKSSLKLGSLPFPLLSTNWTLHVKARDTHLNFATPTSEANASETLTELLIHISRHTPEDMTLFGIRPSQDSEFSLFVVKPQTPVLTEYEIRNILEILMPRGSRDEVLVTSEEMERQLRDVLRLQKKLKAIPFETHPEVVPFSEIQEAIPIIDWEKLVGSWYNESLEGTVESNYTLVDKIYGFNTSYYEELTTVISGFPRETLYNLLLLRWSHILLRHKLTSDYEEACLQQVSTTIPGKIVLYGSAEPGSQELMNRMLQTIRSHLKTSLERLKWMDEGGIEEARKKFNEMDFVLGFSGEDEILEIRMEENWGFLEILSNVLEWQTTNMFKSIAENRESVFLNSEVFYSTEKNQITISRALLHYPYISSRLPNYTNFATIASRILPQLIHAFDERGRFYDSHGTRRNWWNTDTEKYFRIIVQCFDGMMQNVLGVSVAIGLNAYNSTSEPYAILPGRENSTDTMLFFYSFVKTMCSSDAEKINMALASVPQFMDAFKCGGSAKMNPRTKCRMAT